MAHDPPPGLALVLRLEFLMFEYSARDYLNSIGVPYNPLIVDL